MRIYFDIQTTDHGKRWLPKFVSMFRFYENKIVAEVAILFLIVLAMQIETTNIFAHRYAETDFHLLRTMNRLLFLLHF